jgi:endonuclease/exonuclease/phosphatase family metal-dependent hydrolase
VRPAAALLAALLLAPAGVAGLQGPPPVRVVTYNIHHAEGRDGVLDLSRIADVLRPLDADLIALQEVDRGTSRTEGMDQLAELAALLGMHGEFGRAMDHAGGHYGNAILSRWPIVDVRNDPLPHSAEYEPRTALTVRLRVGEGGPALWFTSTHLDNSRDPEEKLRQARRLLELLAAHGEPALLAGDFNARPGTGVIETLGEAFSLALPDGFTLGPAEPPVAGDGPGRRRGPRGDLVLFRPAAAWRVVESRSIDESVASDHRPVLTVLEWIGGRP